MFVGAKHFISTAFQAHSGHLGRYQNGFDRALRGARQWVLSPPQAGVTQLVECDLAKVDVAGSNPVSRSIPTGIYLKHSSHPLHFYTSIMYM